MIKYQLCKKEMNDPESKTPTVELPDNAQDIEICFYGGKLFVRYLVPVKE